MTNHNVPTLPSSTDALVNKDIAELLSLLLEGNPNDNVKTAASIVFE